MFKEYNRNVEVRNTNTKEARTFIASMDVEKLYPSMKTESCCNVVKEVIKESKLSIKDLDVKELSTSLTQL